MNKYLAALNSEVISPSISIARGISWNNPLELFFKIYRHFMTDSLYRNSIYLILSTAIQAFFGFFFWIIAARLYSPEQVGIATTLISVMTLISGFSTLGLNVGLVRFLPKSQVKNEKINSSFLITALASIIISVGFLIGLKVFSPKLLFLQFNISYMVLFIFFATTLSVNGLVESIFVANRSAKFTLMKNTVLSIVKVVLPVFMVVFSAYGIYASVGIANIIAFCFSIGLLVYNFNYHPKISLNISIVKKMCSYSFANYVAGFLNGLPQTILPLIITNRINATESGFFYIAMMIANFINIIPTATTQSLFAEGSYGEYKLEILIKKVIKITLLIMIPIILGFVFFGKYILLFFGKQYSYQALILLQLLAISSIFVSINYIFGTVMRIKDNIKELFVFNIIGPILTISLSYILISKSLFGIGIAFMLSDLLVTLLLFAWFSRMLFKEKLKY